MGLFDSLFGGTSRSQKTKATSHSPQKPRNTFSFVPSVLSEFDAQFSSATWDENTVYCNYPHGPQPIGYFEPASDRSDMILVLDVSDRGQIGFIDLSYKHGLIFLSRSAVYQRYKSYEGAKAPIPPIELFAEIYHFDTHGSIYDENGRQLLANYTGDKIGAAAAFICLSSEVHMDSKYAKFLSDWPKF